MADERKALVKRLEREVREELGEPVIVPRNTPKRRMRFWELPIPEHDMKVDEFRLLAAAYAADTHRDEADISKQDYAPLVGLLKSEAPVAGRGLLYLSDLFRRHQLKPRGKSRPTPRQREECDRARNEALTFLSGYRLSQNERLALADILEQYDLAKPQGGKQRPNYERSGKEYQLAEAEAVFGVLRDFWHKTVGQTSYTRDESGRKFVDAHEVEFAGFRFSMSNRDSVLKATVAICGVDEDVLENAAKGSRGSSNGWRKKKRRSADL